MLSRSILTVAVSLVLAACGGGGGGGGEGSVSRTPPKTQATTDLVIPTIPSSAPPIANIARARPRPGSVTQSSNVGADGITLDQITFNRSGFTISNRNGFTFTNPDDADDIDYFSNRDMENYYHTHKAVYDLNDEYYDKNPKEKEFIKRMYIDYNFNNIIDGIKGGEFVSASYRETDYLILGYWGKYDSNLNERTYLEIGTFVTGGDLFNDNMPIEGRVTYQGTSTVISFEGNNITQIDDGSNLFPLNNDVIGVVGDSSLSVDFGTGIISGTITNFLGFNIKANQKNNTLQDISGELTLNNANIGSNNSGFFEGNLTGSLDGKTYKGLYGGQFYGNNESDGKPGTVAGTLGGVSNDGQFTITGFWMGDK